MSLFHGNLISSKTIRKGLGLMKRSVPFLAVALVGTLAAPAGAQGLLGPDVPALGGTAWVGRESLQGFGELGFAFRPDGVALMCDARRNVKDINTYAKGTWSQDGANITIRFNDCVYRGRIVGVLLSGTGQYLTGSRQTWSFYVRLVQPQGGAPAPAAMPGPDAGARPLSTAPAGMLPPRSGPEMAATFGQGR